MNNSVRLQHFRKNDTINAKIYSRNIPSSNVQMNFSPRSVNTKYSVMPVLDHRKEATVPLKTYGNYDSETVFFPGNIKSHHCGFSRNVDRESTLRNQFFALQKADQARYIPPSTSDLYENSIDFLNTNSDLDNSLIFRTEDFDDFNPNLSNMIGSNIFNNSTRVQLKNLK